MKNIFLIILFYLPVIGFTQCPNLDASFTVSNLSPNIGDEVTFTYNGTITQTCSWYLDFFGSNSDFNIQGSYPFQLSPNQILGTMTFSTVGSQVVNFNVDGGNSCVETSSITINVGYSNGLPPIATFKPHLVNICLGNSILFELKELPVPHPNYTLINVNWNMGDSPQIFTTSSLSISHQYLVANIYYISATLIYSDASGNLISVAAKLPNTQNTSTQLRVFSGDIENLVGGVIQYPNNTGGTDVDFYYYGSSFPNESFQSSPWWTYTLTLDGSIVYNNDGSTFLNHGDLMYSVDSLSAGLHTLTLNTGWKGGDGSDPNCPESKTIKFTISNTPCDTCNSFKPEPNEEYWMSAWVHVNEPSQVRTFNPTNKENTINNTTAYADAFIEFKFSGVLQSAQFYPTGDIIDGWQRIVGKFLLPSGTLDFSVELNADDVMDTYFDDIRIHPFNASMKSYVYDGETFWLTSELDDNNYATFYEYDKEGGLIRIKKETSRGIVTIQETRSNSVKND